MKKKRTRKTSKPGAKKVMSPWQQDRVRKIMIEKRRVREAVPILLKGLLKKKDVDKAIELAERTEKELSL